MAGRRQIRAREDNEAHGTPDRLVAGRILEALEPAADGGRQYRVRIINAGESANRRMYPEAVLHAAAPRYEGARVFDHHRSPAEMESSTVAGMIGTVHTVEAVTGGIDGTLHMLTTPGAVHAAAVLDASLAAEAAGRPQIAGLSHDVLMSVRPGATRGVQEATSIDRVLSVDVVADPAAGGRAQRSLAGGQTMNIRALLARLAAAADDAARRAILAGEDAQAVLTAAGLTADEAMTMNAALTPPATGDQGQTGTGTGSAAPAAGADAGAAGAVAGAAPAAPAAATAAEPPVPVLVEAASLVGRSMIREALAEFPEAVGTAIRPSIPPRFTEAQLVAHVAGTVSVLRAREAAQAASQLPAERGGATVVTDEIDRKVEALDSMWTGSGYPSLRAAWMDWTGYRPDFMGGADVNRRIMRECRGNGEFDSSLIAHGPQREGETPAQYRRRSVESIAAGRTLEALTTTTWAEILGDSVTRRMMQEYNLPGLDSWRQIVSNIFTLNDFRTQRIGRIGGYGLLPAVAQGAPYQPLVSPPDEEVTYSPTKRGGTEALTLEMIANDDMRAVQRIPRALARSAAMTLYRFVWDFLDTNPIIYDGLNLFDAGGHLNTTSTALSSTGVETARANMRQLAAYGNTLEILGLTPRYLVVAPELETLATMLTSSAYALPAGAPVGAASNLPNPNTYLTPIVVDYISSATKWILVADPSRVPTIEVGFYQGRQLPELFTQNDPNNGSMFDNDVLTYKIRHIYGATVLDYRGFSRGNS